MYTLADAYKQGVEDGRRQILDLLPKQIDGHLFHNRTGDNNRSDFGNSRNDKVGVENESNTKR